MTLSAGLPLLALAIVAQGFFSGSEMAIVSANRAVMKARASEGHRGAILALSMLEQEERVFGTCLLGTNVSLVTSVLHATIRHGVIRVDGEGTPLTHPRLVAGAGDRRRGQVANPP